MLTFRSFGCLSCFAAVAWGSVFACFGPRSWTRASGPSATAQGGAARTPTAAQPGRKLPPPPGARRLDPNADVWIDLKRKAVVVDGQVCLRKGPLEMFACTRGTKEYESIVVVNTKAYVVHAALLTLGAKPGAPARFTPNYVPARGTEIKIQLLWIGPDGKKHWAQAQDWVRNVRTGKAMTHNWVFAGSGFWTDPETGRKYYQAEGGDFICVSNFPSAMLDLPIESTQANENLLFAAYTERIPQLGTPVRLLLLPKPDGKAARSHAGKLERKPTNPPAPGGNP